MDNSHNIGNVQTRKLSIGGTVKGSFGNLIDSLGFYIVSGIIFLIVTFIPYALLSIMIGGDLSAGLLVAIVMAVAISTIAEFMFIVAWMNCSLRSFRGEKIRFSDFNILKMRVLKSSIPIIVIYSFLAAPFLFLFIDLLVFVIVYILFVPLHLYLNARFVFASTAMLENSSMGMMEALSYSSKITKNLKTRLHIILILLVLYILASAAVGLTFGLGTVVYFALIAIIHTYIYLALKDRQHQS